MKDWIDWTVVQILVQRADLKLSVNALSDSSMKVCKKVRKLQFLSLWFKFNL